jgi:hypothetical protein
MMKANDALTNTKWLRDVRDALQQQSEEIQRLKNELAEKQKYVLQVERYGGQLRAALRRIKVIGDESHENDAHCCAHEAEQALEQE